MNLKPLGRGWNVSHYRTLTNAAATYAHVASVCRLRLRGNVCPFCPVQYGIWLGGCCLVRYGTQALFLSGSGTLSFGAIKRKRPRGLQPFGFTIPAWRRAERQGRRHFATNRQGRAWSSGEAKPMPTRSAVPTEKPRSRAANHNSGHSSTTFAVKSPLMSSAFVSLPGPG